MGILSVITNIHIPPILTHPFCANIRSIPMEIHQVSEADSIQKVSFTNNDANDQFPITIKKVHQFYFFKFQSVEYLHLKAKIKEAEKRISDLNQSRSQVAEKLKERTVI